MYRVKHQPSGLYYQPHKHRGSNLSKRGKVYQTQTHGLSTAFKSAEYYKDQEHQVFSVYCEKNSQIHKQTMALFKWEECSWSYNQLRAETKISDWVIEQI